MRVPVPGGHRACADPGGPQARRGKHRRVGERLRIETFSGFGERQQCIGHGRCRARQVCGEKRAADLRRDAGLLFMAGLHGRVRSAGTRDCAGAGAGDAAPGRELRRITKREMHRRSGAAAGERSAFSATGRGEPGGVGAESRKEDYYDLPALRAHHSGGLEGVWHAARGGASQRVLGAAFGRAELCIRARL